jgi:uncharacterized membrane protein YgdD (TMEM256/DUF423 family)
MKKFLKIACLYGILGIVFGAFGAHAIKSKLPADQYANYKVGVEYLFFHIVPLLYLSTKNLTQLRRLSGHFFTMGILFFTGSILLMDTQLIHHVDVHFLWPITPIGGLLMLFGWATMLWDAMSDSL